MSINVAPSPNELVERASELVPLLRSKAEWHETNRRLHEDVIEALAQSGIFHMRRPARYGGYETDSGTLARVLGTLALGDGSTAWNASVWSISNWIACLFPDHVQDEVFSTPATRVCAVLSPTGMAGPADGGIVVNGRWHFISGALHSHWQVIIAMAPAPGGGHWPVMALVPMSELAIDDDWDTSGLCGTGSVTTIANDLFVPEDRVLPLPLILQGRYASRINASSPVFSAPMVPTGCAGFVGVAVGLARAAREEFLIRLPGRKITYTDYASQSAAPLTHLQLAAATMRIDEAGFHADRITGTLDRIGGQPWSLDDRVLVRASLGRCMQLAKDAVDQLNTASGGSSVYRSVPMQRIHRDMTVASLHALMHPDTNYELYGRVLCGLEPNTSYL